MTIEFPSPLIALWTASIMIGVAFMLWSGLMAWGHSYSLDDGIERWISSKWTIAGSILSVLAGASWVVWDTAYSCTLSSPV